MSDSHRTTLRYEDLDWLQSIEDDNESDLGSRSTSTLSWTDDNEQEISQEMRNQYDLFESALYSELDGEDLPEPIIKEVEMWKQYSPHLRITGTNIFPTFQEEIKEKYPADYEEIYAVHFDKDDIADQLKNKCNIGVEEYEEPDKLTEEDADNLIETVWSDVIKETEPCLQKKETQLSSLSSVQSPKNENKTFRSPNKDRRLPLYSRSYLSRHEERCNYIVKKGKEQTEDMLSPSWRLCKLSPTVFHPRPTLNASKVPRRISGATSARLPKRKLLINEFIPQNSQIAESSNSGSTRYGILPPIQAMPIIPKLPNKRANSAMLRFTKTFPRTRPNTSKHKPIFITPVNVGDNFDKVTKKVVEAEEIAPRDGYLSPLVPTLLRRSGKKQIIHSKVPWRY